MNSRRRLAAVIAKDEGAFLLDWLTDHRAFHCLLERLCGLDE